MIGPAKEYGKTNARTKVQRRCLELREQLPDLTERERHWCEGLFVEKGFYFRTKKSVWCLHCGMEHDAELAPMAVSIGIKHRCPYCGTLLQVEQAEQRKKRMKGEEGYFQAVQATFIQTIAEFTVLRTFYVERENVRGNSTRHHFTEIWQIWVRDDGKETILTKRYTRSPFYFHWQFDSEWRIGKHNDHCSGYYVMSDVYDLAQCAICSDEKVSPILRRNGWHKVGALVAREHTVKIMQKLLTDPLAEELAKTGMRSVLMHWVQERCNRDYLVKWMHAVRIAVRRGYPIESADMYFDYLDLLEYFGKDTHNAHYVCPALLHDVHDRLVMKKEAVEHKKELEQRMREVEKAEPSFRKHRGMFFGICFGNADIMVVVLGSVREILEEGLAMKHCVFVNQYYSHKVHPNSLILSARDSRGNRLETVEVNTATWDVVQSRGFKNGTTPRHDEIVKLVNDNMNRLKMEV